MTTVDDATFRAAVARQIDRWADALALMADPTCDDPACPGCVEKHRREDEES